jgi:methyl-accepting chemotaxis protein
VGWTLLTGVYTDDINVAALRSVYEIVAVVAVLAGLLSAIVILVNRGLRGSLGGEPEYAVRIAERIAENDLSVAVLVHGHVGSLLHSMSTMQTRLVSTIGTVKRLAESISLGSSEIAKASARN